MYKIEIWRYKVIVDTFEDEHIEEIYNWFNNEGYKWQNENGENAFIVYEDGKIVDNYVLQESRFYD